MARSRTIALLGLATAGFAMAEPLPLAPIQQAMVGRAGTFIIIDCASGETTDLDPKASAERLPPCSTSIS